MAVFDCTENLDLEIVSIQTMDRYFKNNVIRLGSCFLLDEYQEFDLRMKKEMENLLNQEDRTEKDFKPREVGYTIDDLLEELVADIDIYSCIYKIPDITITNTEWELFFNQVAIFYKSIHLQDFFIEDAILLNRMVLAHSLVYEQAEVNLRSYISSLRYIESDILSMSNIIELAEKLGEVFGIDAISMIANKYGSYGCLGKPVEEFLKESDFSQELTESVLKSRLEAYNYEVVTALNDNDTNSNKENNHLEKVVSLRDYMLRKGKIIDKQ